MLRRIVEHHCIGEESVEESLRGVSAVGYPIDGEREARIGSLDIERIKLNPKAVVKDVYSRSARRTTQLAPSARLGRRIVGHKWQILFPSV